MNKKELKENEKKLRKMTEYRKPLHSFTYNELHQRVLGRLEGYQEDKKDPNFIKEINKFIKVSTKVYKLK